MSKYVAETFNEFQEKQVAKIYLTLLKKTSTFVSNAGVTVNKSSPVTICWEITPGRIFFHQ